MGWLGVHNICPNYLTRWKITITSIDFPYFINTLPLNLELLDQSFHDTRQHFEDIDNQRLFTYNDWYITDEIADFQHNNAYKVYYRVTVA